VNAITGRQEGFLKPIDKGGGAARHISHRSRYNHIFVIVDTFSKYVLLYPTRSTGVDEVVTCLERQAVCFGNLYRIVSDRGAAFTSHMFREYCDREKIQHLMIATGVPRETDK